MAHPRVASDALFFDDADQVLLVEPSYKALFSYSCRQVACSAE